MRSKGRALTACTLLLGSMAVPSLWASWSTEGLPVCTAAGNQEYPMIISDCAGGAIITWEDQRSAYDVYAQRVASSGDVQWTTDGITLCSATGSRLSPVITSDGVGGAIVAWDDTRSQTGIDIYAQRVDGAGALLWTPDGVALCASGKAQLSPQITSDGAGGAIITWIDSRSGNNDIYVQRVDASGTVLWTPDGVALCANTGNQESPQIISDGAGGAIVTWGDNRGGNYDIYAQRVNAAGTVQWIVDGLAICTAPEAQNAPLMTADGTGGAIITWPDHRSGGGDLLAGWVIYVQRVSVSGVVQWAANGVALSAATGTQLYPAITSDGVCGAIVTWMNYLNGTKKLQAQRVNASGNLMWTYGGIALSGATGDQFCPLMASDGAGGAVVAWYDNRNGDYCYDIYAQRVNDLGTVQWTADGVPICTAETEQSGCRITSDQAGGAVLTWYDGRNGYWDIYAQRITGEGQQPAATVLPAMPLTLFQNEPNPFNPSTTIRYYLPEEARVRLDVYSVSGAKIATLAEGVREKGTHSVSWTGRDRSGRAVASGIYFYCLTTNKETISRKMVLIR
jgi:hypothetical protein